MRMLLRLWIFLFVVATFPGAAKAQGSIRDDRAAHLSIAGGYFPQQWGNPFSSTSITRQPLWSAIFDPLTLVTTDGDLLPWLATGWEQTSETTWRITLRTDVVFSNGEPFNAAAVVAAVSYLTSPAGQREPVGRELGVIESAHALDDQTVEIATHHPDPLLPYKLSMLRPLAPALWQRQTPDAYFAAPAGTGPYRVSEVGPTQTTLSAAPRSWRRAPSDRLRFLVLLDPATRQAALATGQADVAISAVSPDEFETLRANGGQVFIDRIPAVVSLAFNTVNDTPFRHQAVREAVSHAVDRAAIVGILLGGETVVANQPAPRSAFGFNTDIQTRAYDPARARVLLRDAGYENGFDVVMEMPSGAVLYTDAFQKVAADLALVGIDLEVRTVPQIKFLENTQTGDWGGDTMAIPFFTPVGDALYAMRQNSCLWHAAYYCDAAAVTLIEDALSETDLAQRKQKTRAVMQHAHDTAQALFLYETVSFIGLGQRVQSFRADFGFIRYEQISLAAN